MFTAGLPVLSILYYVHMYIKLYILSYNKVKCNESWILFRVGRFATLGVLYGCDTLAVCRACECKISEIVEFLNSDREHMQQGIFPDVQQSYLLHSALNFDKVS